MNCDPISAKRFAETLLKRRGGSDFFCSRDGLRACEKGAVALQVALKKSCKTMRERGSEEEEGGRVVKRVRDLAQTGLHG